MALPQKLRIILVFLILLEHLLELLLDVLGAEAQLGAKPLEARVVEQGTFVVRFACDGGVVAWWRGGVVAAVVAV